MKSLLVKLFLLRKYICIYLFCYFFHGIVAAERGGFLYFNFLCYQNPGNRLLSGKICDSSKSDICDPTFTICISNHYIKDEITLEKCNVHYEQTDYYSNVDSVCNHPYDNRKHLAKEIRKELSLPLHKSYFVKIEVRDFNWRESSLISSFAAEFDQPPSANMSQVFYKNMRMFRTDFRYANPKTSLNISMGLQCNHDRYGEYCLDFCKPNSQNILFCTKDGQRVCAKGWKGVKCDTKDLCAFVSCIKSGQCLEIKGKAECLCNKQIGPHCYSNYNPCSNNPCKNEGICSPKKVGEIGYDCQCKHPFSGPQCANKIHICESKPCKNNGSCHHIKPDAFHCKCLQGFYGRFCELKTVNGSRSNLISGRNVILICSLLGILVLNLVIVFIACFISKRRAKRNKKLQQIDEKTMSKKELGRKINSLPDISYQHSVASPTHTPYEELDKMSNYDSLDYKKYEYLEPCCSIIPPAGQLLSSNSGYVEMSEKHDTTLIEPKEVPVENNSCHLPAIPIRKL